MTENNEVDRLFTDAYMAGASMWDIKIAMGCSFQDVMVRRWQLRLSDRDRHGRPIPGQCTHPFDFDGTGTLR